MKDFIKNILDLFRPPVVDPEPIISQEPVVVALPDVLSTCSPVEDAPQWVTEARSLLPISALKDPRLTELPVDLWNSVYIVDYSGRVFLATAYTVFWNGKLSDATVTIQVGDREIDSVEIEGWMPLEREQAQQIFSRIKMLSLAEDLPFIP